MFWKDFLWYFDYNYLKNFVAFVFEARSLNARDQHLCRAKLAFEFHAKQEVSSEMLRLQAVYDFVVETLKGLVPVSITNSQLKPITRSGPLVFTSLHLCLQQGLQFVHSKSTGQGEKWGRYNPTPPLPHATQHQITQLPYKFCRFFAPPDCTCCIMWTWNEWEIKGQWEISLSLVLRHPMND